MITLFIWTYLFIHTDKTETNKHHFEMLFAAIDSIRFVVAVVYIHRSNMCPVDLLAVRKERERKRSHLHIVLAAGSIENILI